MCVYVFLSWISSEVEVNHLAHIISLNWHIDIFEGSIIQGRHSLQVKKLTHSEVQSLAQSFRTIS